MIQRNGNQRNGNERQESSVRTGGSYNPSLDPWEWQRLCSQVCFSKIPAMIQRSGNYARMIKASEALTIPALIHGNGNYGDPLRPGTNNPPPRSNGMVTDRMATPSLS